MRPRVIVSSPITIIFLIIIPIIVSLLFFFIHKAGPLTDLNLLGVDFNLFGVYASAYAALLGSLYDVTTSSKDKPQDYYNKIGFENLVREYQFSRKYFYTAIAIAILLAILSFYPTFELRPIDERGDLNLFSFYAMLAIFPPILIVGSRFVTYYAKRDLDYYLAKAYFKVSSQKQNELEEFRNLVLMLNTYNRFLERNLKLKIKDIQVHSVIISTNAAGKNKIRNSIGGALENEDKLELARELAKLPGLPNKEEFLIKESPIFNQLFKEVLTVIIPAVIGILSFIITISPSIISLLN